MRKGPAEGEEPRGQVRVAANPAPPGEKVRSSPSKTTYPVDVDVLMKLRTWPLVTAKYSGLPINAPAATRAIDGTF
jgi:hypothetical protein